MLNLGKTKWDVQILFSKILQKKRRECLNILFTFAPYPRTTFQCKSAGKRNRNKNITAPSTTPPIAQATSFAHFLLSS